MQKPLGQDKTIKLFKGLISTERLSHAYLLEGETGTGKKTLANHIVKLMMCHHLNACDNCNSCMCVNLGTHPDIINISNDDRQTIGIDKIRELNVKVFEKPVISKYKAVIINNAHLLTKDAQNAMLKLIEEPPCYAIFIMLCDSKAKMLKTVLSRVTVINMYPLNYEELKTIVPDAPEFMYRYCSGNAGKLLSLKTDEDFIELRAQTFNMLEKFCTSDRYSIYDSIGLLSNEKTSFIKQTDMLTSFFRDCMTKSLGAKQMTLNLDKEDKISALCNRFSANKVQKFLNLIEITLNTQKEITRNGNLTIAKHIMLMKYWEVINDNSNRNTF